MTPLVPPIMLASGGYVAESFPDGAMGLLGLLGLYVASTNYVVISDEQADHFLTLQGTPELKKALKNWVG